MANTKTKKKDTFPSDMIKSAIARRQRIPNSNGPGQVLSKIPPGFDFKNRSVAGKQGDAIKNAAKRRLSQIDTPRGKDNTKTKRDKMLKAMSVMASRRK